MKLKQSQFLNLNLYQKMANEASTQATTLDQTQTDDSSLDQFDWDNEGDAKKSEEFLSGTTSQAKPAKKTKVEEIAEKDDDIEIEGEDDKDKNKGGWDDEDKDKDDGNEEVDEEDEDEKDKDKKDKDKPKDKTKLEPVKPSKDKPTEDSTDNFLTFAETLKEEGVFEHLELPKGKKKISAEELVELVQKEKELSVDAGLKEMFEGLDEDGVAYIKFIKNGGKTADFVSTFVDNSLPDINIEDKKTHKDVILLYLTSISGLDDEDAEAQYDTLKENNTTEKYAKRYYSKLQEIDTDNKTKLVEGQERKARKEAKERVEFANSLDSTLSESEVLGVPLTEKDKRVLKDVISKPSKVLDGKKVTTLQYKLNEAFKDPKKLVVLAKLLNEDFKFDFIEAKAKTKNANKIRTGLERMKEQGKDTRSSGNSMSKKSLADFFPD